MNPVVHLELHTGDLPGACATYAKLMLLCLSSLAICEIRG
jgi:hypothetical protein